ncbi:MAG TPA: hypothetical protein VFK72_05665 [Nevskia sp.]|nr:hypothetical protein [Nevskia sp.]
MNPPRSPWRRSRKKPAGPSPQGSRADFYTWNPIEPTMRLWKCLGLPV